MNINKLRRDSMNFRYRKWFIGLINKWTSFNCRRGYTVHKVGENEYKLVKY